MEKKLNELEMGVHRLNMDAKNALVKKMLATGVTEICFDRGEVELLVENPRESAYDTCSVNMILLSHTERGVRIYWSYDGPSPKYYAPMLWIDIYRAAEKRLGAEA